MVAKEENLSEDQSMEFYAEWRLRGDRYDNGSGLDGDFRGKAYLCNKSVRKM